MPFSFKCHGFFFLVQVIQIIQIPSSFFVSFFLFLVNSLEHLIITWPVRDIGRIPPFKYLPLFFFIDHASKPNSNLGNT